MMPGAINTALQTGQMPRPQPARGGMDPRMMQALGQVGQQEDARSQFATMAGSAQA
jgi:hypothetical protein